MGLPSAESLRARIPDVNDGIVAVAGVVQGLLAAGAGYDALVAASAVATIAGGASLAGTTYAGAAADRDAELALIREELTALESDPEAELEELAAYYRERGVEPDLAREVARQVSALVPSVERLTFGKNGSDACTLAARLARVFTGRRTLLFSGYHGWQDFWAEQSGFAQSGVPERVPPLIHRFRMNDVDDFERLFERHRADLAAVMLEPAGAVEGPQGPVPDADAAFLRHLRQRTREAGALLVFDEIFTCFRYPGHTVQQATGVAPDLTCLGKALGGGLPLSALGGRADVLESAMDRTHYGPTFRGEAYALAAARAALAVYQREPVAAHVWSHGERLRALLDAAGREAGLAARCVGPPFRMVVAFDEPDAQRQRLLGTLLHQELLRRGVLTYKGFWLPSWGHDDGTLEQAAAAARAAFAALARALRAGRLDEALETPLLAL